MNPIFQQLCPEEEKYLDAVQKFHDAIDAFRKLTPQQKQHFCEDVFVMEMISEIYTDFNVGVIYLDEATIHGMWNYYLMLEKDFENTSRYVEPFGQENVYSFEFAKLLILACTEVESVFKAICHEINSESVAENIIAYKGIILEKYPKITEAKVKIKYLNRSIFPFAEWKEKSDLASPSWWKAYQHVKHNRGGNFSKATYLNAVSALAALYILIFYLANITQIGFDNNASSYIVSDYSDVHLSWGSSVKLPDFEKEL